jgi:hypothetical protein
MNRLVIVTALFIAGVIALVAALRLQAVSETTTDSNVTFIGTVSCSRCQGIQPLHKGYTRWTWALHSVSEGDDIVLVVGNDTYTLQGDKDRLSKYMESKAKVSGSLKGRTLTVQTISRPDRKPTGSKGKPSHSS